MIKLISINLQHLLIRHPLLFLGGEHRTEEFLSPSPTATLDLPHKYNNPWNLGRASMPPRAPRKKKE